MTERIGTDAGRRVWRAAPFLRYLLVGGGLFVLDFAVFVALHLGLGLRVGWSQAVSRTVGAAAGFVGHRAISFPAEQRTHSMTQQGAGYLALTIVNMVISPLLVEGLQSVLGGRGLAAKLITDVIMVLETYVLLKYLFRSRSDRHA